MSNDELRATPSAVQAITTRLGSLLDLAAELKPSTSINPPLSSSQLEPHLDGVAGTPPDGASLEAAARQILYACVAASPIDSPGFVRAWNLLDILIACKDVGQCEAQLPLWLVEELLDTQTLEGCARVFDFLESRARRLIPFGVGQADGKTLVVMRSCNALLKRLSGAEDAVFCGRVLMFLFRAFPLGSKGLVNLRGEFNVGNETVWDETVGIEDSMDVDEEKKDDAEETGADATQTAQPTDPASTATATKQTESTNKPTQDAATENPELEIHRFYPVFWSLQRYFSNPPSLFDPANLAKFKHGLELTLQKFKSVRTTVQTAHAPEDDQHAVDDNVRGTKRKRSPEPSEPSAFAASFNPKYLTSFDLFALELSDRTFQRHILAQSLIILSFLLTLTPAAKARLARDVPRGQKAVQYPLDLDATEEEWCRAMIKRINALDGLFTGREGGQYFQRSLAAVLSRDRGWARWKAESCPDISLPPVPADTFDEAKTGVRAETRVKRLRPTVAGAMDISFLREPGPTGAAAAAEEEAAAPLSEEARQAMRGPETATLLMEVMSDDFQLDGVVQQLATAEGDTEATRRLKMERRKWVEHRASKTWRALRMTRRARFRLLRRVNEEESVDLLGKSDEEIREEEERVKREKEEEHAMKYDARPEDQDEEEEDQGDNDHENVGMEAEVEGKDENGGDGKIEEVEMEDAEPTENQDVLQDEAETQPEEQDVAADTAAEGDDAGAEQV